MLRIDLKKMQNLFTTREIGEFLENNFFQLGATDVMRLRKLASWSHQRNIEFTKNFYASFGDKKSVFGLALLKMQKTYSDDIKLEDILRGPDKYWNMFWKFARKIADYKTSQRVNSHRAHLRWDKRKKLTTHKRCAILKARIK